MNLTLRKKNGGLPSLFSDFFSPATSLFNRDIFDLDADVIPARLGVNVPTANIKETSKEYNLEIAAPGLERKDFDIEVNNGMLTVSAEKEIEKKEEEEGYSRKEYSFNSFSRSFTLPEDIKEKEIKAKYENGVLKVMVPKMHEKPVKHAQRIDVS